VGDPTALRLTNHPTPDGFPSWSPDGRYIAFVSFRPGGGIFLIRPLGGGEQKLSSLITDSRPAWSGDSKFLVISSMYREVQNTAGAGDLFLLPVEGGGEPRQILASPAGTWYREAAFSPDHRSLAFASCTGSQSRPSCSLHVVGLKNGLYPTGTPRQITTASIDPQAIAWTADGASLVYGAGGSGPGFLWRVHVTGKSPPERLDIAGAGASHPAINHKTGQFAFARSLDNSDIWRIRADGTATPFLTSTLRDTSPQYSPDGKRIAYESGRGGDSVAIWLANADGSGATQATRIASEQCGSPRWSPEGRWIAFDCFEPGGGWDIWTIEASGASPRRLTRGGGDSIAPAWSPDGRWVYYGDKRSGRFEIWRVPAAGGGGEQVTRNGGYIALTSVDGTMLYYTKTEFGLEGLFAKRLPDGGELLLIRERIGWRGFAVFSEGIYYLGAAAQQFKVRFYEFATQRTRTLAEVEGPLQLGLSVSPDRKSFLLSKVVFSGSDLMLIENFR
jgi:eukaryotic-like serine/threonine-protein kinase